MERATKREKQKLQKGTENVRGRQRSEETGVGERKAGRRNQAHGNLAVFLFLH